jgi:alpha-glucosidase
MELHPQGSRWWREAVFYQVYPRSFADANGDGVGDLNGIRAHLDHLTWLGVDALWLSPINPSPMADFGYDVADYTDVDPVFGTLADLDGLVDDLHRRGMRLTLDWVPNHTSHRHPWFLASRSSRADPRRDWYVWRDGAPDGGPPNNWGRAFSREPAWTHDPVTGQWYLHLFLAEQPDLNWSNPAVEAAMLDTLRFWLARGIDGFRADVVHLIGKGTDLPDLPPEFAGQSAVIHVDRPRTHELLRTIRRLLDATPHHAMMIGEVYLLGPSQAATYYGADDELHLVFNFRPVHTPWSAAAFRRRIAEVTEELGPEAWPVWTLSNHDQPRHRTRFGTDARARAAAVLLLGLRGTPYLYAGEELGLEDAVVPPERVVDPGGRDGCRAPIPWDEAAGHGWPADPWLPFPPDAAARSVAAQRADPGSMAWHYRRLLALRRSRPDLRAGTQRLLEVHDDMVAVERAAPSGERCLVAVNLADRTVDTDLPRGVVLAGTHDLAAGRPFGGSLAPDEAVVVDLPG